ncbi:unnamed protein product [Phyllotreta striolata]|uniref:glutathione transferase n=1 Tax=Phyllotreta striolata TaxID=444603 RepID=A0A9N9TTU6_PHYSR|nr:unnamed protein product [Phyllotreta striolata]
MVQYKLYYFNFTGRGEPIRLLFAYGGIPFEDFRFEWEDWPAIKPNMPIGTIPVLEIDGKPFWQTTPLCKYVANSLKLDGKDGLENLSIDCVVDTLWDLLSSVYTRFKESDEERKKQIEKTLYEQVPVILGKFDENVKKNGFIALNRLTWADIVFLSAYEDLMNLVPEKNVFEQYPALIKLKDKILESENIREYLRKRPASKIPKTYDLKNDF